MPATEPAIIFEQIANKARRAGLLKFNAHGVLVIILPDSARAPASSPLEIRKMKPGELEAKLSEAKAALDSSALPPAGG